MAHFGWNGFPSFWQQWLTPAALLLGASILGLLFHFILFTVLKHFTSRTPRALDEIFVSHSRKPSRLFFPLLGFYFALPFSRLPRPVAEVLDHIILLAMIASVAWLAAAMTRILQEAVELRFNIQERDNLRARKIKTQMMLLRRILVVTIIIIAAGLMLMTVPGVRNIGTTLFASAGILGLIAGMAARPVLSNLLAGIQIALSDSIRLDDVVIVEGEWGRIEEITTVYVVVRLWDLRRLILPLSYFIEKPFQNWTRTSADLIGSVHLHTDYTVPVEEIRRELLRILENSGLWDGKVWNLQVTAATDRGIELRALMSASDSSAAWDLRCLVREKLIAFLQAHYPQCLPKHRLAL